MQGAANIKNIRSSGNVLFMARDVTGQGAIVTSGVKGGRGQKGETGLSVEGSYKPNWNSSILFYDFPDASYDYYNDENYNDPDAVGYGVLRLRDMIPGLGGPGGAGGDAGNIGIFALTTSSQIDLVADPGEGGDPGEVGDYLYFPWRDIPYTGRLESGLYGEPWSGDDENADIFRNAFSDWEWDSYESRWDLKLDADYERRSIDDNDSNYFYGLRVAGAEILTPLKGPSGLPGLLMPTTHSPEFQMLPTYLFGKRGLVLLERNADKKWREGNSDNSHDAVVLYKLAYSYYCEALGQIPDGVDGISDFASNKMYPTFNKNGTFKELLPYIVPQDVIDGWYEDCKRIFAKWNRANSGYNSMGFPQDYLSYARPDTIKPVRDSIQEKFESTVLEPWRELLDTGFTTDLWGRMAEFQKGVSSDMLTAHIQDKVSDIAIAKKQLSVATEKADLILDEIEANNGRIANLYAQMEAYQNDIENALSEPPPCDFWCHLGAVWDLGKAIINISTALGNLPTITKLFTEVNPAEKQHRLKSFSALIKDGKRFYKTVMPIYKNTKDGYGAISELFDESSPMRDYDELFKEIDKTGRHTQKTINDLLKFKAEIKTSGHANKNAAIAGVDSAVQALEEVRLINQSNHELSYELLAKNIESGTKLFEVNAHQAALKEAYRVQKSIRDRYIQLIQDNAPLKKQIGIRRNQLALSGRAMADKLLVTDFILERSFNYLYLDEKLPYNFNLDLLALESGDFENFNIKNINQRLTSFLDELKNWSSGSPQGICETVLKMRYRTIGQTACANESKITTVREATSEELEEIEPPFGDGDPLTIGDNDKDDWDIYCLTNGCPSWVADYSQAIQYFTSTPPIAKYYLSESFINDLSSNGVADIEIDPTWSLDLWEAENNSSNHRVTDIDMQLILSTEYAFPEEASIGPMYMSHSENAIFTQPGSGVEPDFLSVEFPYSNVTYTCLSIIGLISQNTFQTEFDAVFSGQSTSQTSPCFGITNWTFKEVKPTNSPLASVAQEKFSSFTNNRIYGQSLRGVWTFDIRSVLQKLAQVDLTSDLYNNTNFTESYTKPIGEDCSDGYFETSDYKNTQRLCTKMNCPGVEEDDPVTPEDETLGNSQCYSFKNALQGVDFKIFWRSRD